jgi:hypothetical protein
MTTNRDVMARGVGFVLGILYCVFLVLSLRYVGPSPISYSPPQECVQQESSDAALDK